ncbi:MAG: PDDEXK nuclease domain-containing protein [Oscillospiraceae bacterium]|jgi:predicted nuclease of restriction endonuclease-like (RecB) superfamily|nr:PDDEXK nuclease domain-containing protein [Oscillospiraceae bacterium]
MENGLAKYGEFIKEIKELIYRHQYEAMKQVNKELIELYWEIGEEIFHRQQQGWGKSVVEILSKELQKEFPGVQGFSARNLWLMRRFYVEYTQTPVLHPMGAELVDSKLHPLGAVLNRTQLPALLAEIGWKKNTVIIEKCKDPLEREFYIRITKKFGWTKDVLINNIENQVYEKYLTNQTNFDETVPEKYRHQAKLAIKDEYSFDFLEMGTEHSEGEFETAIIKKIRTFLIEMGGLYTFVGNQYHIDAAGDDCYIDLLLYHRQLRSLIALELKVGDFIPEYTGKMQYYLAVLDEKIKLPDENPSIGIIICKSKKRTKVEYALRLSNAPIGVATYTYKKIPEEMRSLLPSPDEIAEIIREIGSDDDDEV